jgi:hypothetical protein
MAIAVWESQESRVIAEADQRETGGIGTTETWQSAATEFPTSLFRLALFIRSLKAVCPACIRLSMIVWQ